MLMCQLLIYRRISERTDIDALQRSGALDDEFVDSSLNVALRDIDPLLTRQ
jgi:hypothetical protein